MINPLHTVAALYRYWRRRLHVRLVNRMLARDEKFDRKLKRSLRITDKPHSSTVKASETYMRSLK